MNDDKIFTHDLKFITLFPQSEEIPFAEFDDLLPGMLMVNLEIVLELYVLVFKLLF